MIAHKLKLKEDCQFKDNNDAIASLETINLMREFGNVIELPLLLSVDNELLNIIKVIHTIYDEMAYAQGILYLIVMDGIDNMCHTKSIMFEEQMSNCIDYGVCVDRSHKMRLKTNYRITLQIARTCDIILDYKISLNDEGEHNYIDACDVEIKIGDKSIMRSEQIKLNTYQPICLNMQSVDVVIGWTIMIITFPHVINTNDLVVTFGETYLHSQIRRELRNKHALLSLHII